MVCSLLFMVCGWQYSETQPIFKYGLTSRLTMKLLCFWANDIVTKNKHTSEKMNFIMLISLSQASRLTVF